MDANLEKLLDAWADRIVQRVVDGVVERLGRPAQPEVRVARLLDVDAVAARLGRTRQAVYKLVERGRLQATRNDGRLHVSSAVIDAFVAGDPVRPSKSAAVRKARAAENDAEPARKPAPVDPTPPPPAPVERRAVASPARPAVPGSQPRRSIFRFRPASASPARPPAAAPAGGDPASAETLDDQVRRLGELLASGSNADLLD
jgi:hypothetical protein